jgi:2-polyprenyl-3-methyl-5-hydroxy-6-metoxy-1,4-benzoquinol methylase
VEDVGDLLPKTLDGERVLDVACGHGRASRGLARLGAEVVGVDISVELIAMARAREADDSLGVVYYAADVADPSTWWSGGPFDGAVCEMAVTDIDDVVGTIHAVAATVDRMRATTSVDLDALDPASRCGSRRRSSVPL